MLRFPPETSVSGRGPSSSSDETSHSRLDELLRGANSALALNHRLNLLNIEAKRRLAQYHAYHSRFNPDQPRVPAGHPDGGQWTRVGAAQVATHPRVISDVEPDNDWKPGAQYASNGGRGLVPIRVGGQWFRVEPGLANQLYEAQTRADAAIARVRQFDPNWRPTPQTHNSVQGAIRAYEAEAEQAQARLRELIRIDPPPIIPKTRPPTAEQRHEILREIANWLLKNKGREFKGEPWILEYESIVESYLDPPRPLHELQRGLPNRKPGYDIHHIVEKSSAYQDGFLRDIVERPDNVVLIPRFRHWEITSWYMTKSRRFGDMSPREYLRGRDWLERMDVGLDALIRHGVLTP